MPQTIKKIKEELGITLTEICNLENVTGVISRENAKLKDKLVNGVVRWEELSEELREGLKKAFLKFSNIKTGKRQLLDLPIALTIHSRTLLQEAVQHTNGLCLIDEGTADKETAILLNYELIEFLVRECKCSLLTTGLNDSYNAFDLAKENPKLFNFLCILAPKEDKEKYDQIEQKRYQDEQERKEKEQEERSEIEDQERLRLLYHNAKMDMKSPAQLKGKMTRLFSSFKMLEKKVGKRGRLQNKKKQQQEKQQYSSVKRGPQPFDDLIQSPCKISRKGEKEKSRGVETSTFSTSGHDVGKENYDFPFHRLPTHNKNHIQRTFNGRRKPLAIIEGNTTHETKTEKENPFIAPPSCTLGNKESPFITPPPRTLDDTRNMLRNWKGRVKNTAQRQAGNNACCMPFTPPPASKITEQAPATPGLSSPFSHLYLTGFRRGGRDI